MQSAKCKVQGAKYEVRSTKYEVQGADDPLAAAKMDKTVLTVGTFDDDDTRDYWASRTVDERLAALELMRTISYGYNPVTDRLQRVLTIVERGES